MSDGLKIKLTELAIYEGNVSKSVFEIQQLLKDKDIPLEERYLAYVKIEEHLRVKPFSYDFENCDSVDAYTHGIYYLERYCKYSFADILQSIEDHFYDYYDEELDSYSGESRMIVDFINRGYDHLNALVNEVKVEEAYKASMAALQEEVIASGFGGFEHDW